MLGWNDGTNQEIFSLDELIQKFSIEKVHKGGAKFDYEKAKWFNHEWIKRLPVTDYMPQLKSLMEQKGVPITDEAQLQKVAELVKDRCTLLMDFWEHSYFFFQRPQQYDMASVKVKWNEAKAHFFTLFAKEVLSLTSWSAASLEELFKQLATQANIKPGELQLPLRIMLVGGKFGPPVFQIAEVLGKEETVYRIENALQACAEERM